MMPIRRGDGTGLSVPAFSEVRKGDGTVLWSRAPDIPDSVLLPESDDLTHFAGATSDYDINSNSPKFNTQYTDLSLKYTGTGGDFIGSTSGLSVYPTIGQTHRVACYLSNGTNSIVDVFFGGSSNTSRGDAYSVRFDAKNDTLRLVRWDSGNFNPIDNNASSVGSGWYEAEILHQSDGSISATFYDEAGSNLGTASGTDSTHLTSGSYDSTVVGVEVAFDESDAVDFWRFV